MTDALADLTAACDQAREASARKLEPRVITEAQAATLRKIRAQLCPVCKREICPCSDSWCEKCHDMEPAP